MNNLNKRNSLVDIMKGICIILMVAGHANFPLTKFIYLFHMPVFFMLSGYCYKTNYSDSLILVVSFIKKRGTTLWIPFVIWTSIFTILHNVFINFNIYTDNPLFITWDLKQDNSQLLYPINIFNVIKSIGKSILLSGSTQIGCGLWFLAILMKISLLYCFIEYFLKKIAPNKIMILQILISFLLLVIGFACHVNGISLLSIDKVFSYYILYNLGYTIKAIDLGRIIEKGKVPRILLSLVSLGFLILSKKIGYIALDRTDYKHPLFLITVCLLGWVFIYEISYLITKNDVMSKVLVFIGQNTLGILILHLLSFKIVTLLGILLYDYPIYTLASFPILFDNGIWWIIYTTIGVIIPLSLSIGYRKFIEIANLGIR